MELYGQQLEIVRGTEVRAQSIQVGLLVAVICLSIGRGSFWLEGDR